MIARAWSNVVAFATSAGLWSALWLGLAVITAFLLLLMRTRWGQSNPLRKCAVLSLLVHVLIGMYATSVQIITAAGPSFGEAVFGVTFETDGEAPTGDVDGTAQRTWDGLPSEVFADFPAPEKSLDRAPIETAQPDRTVSTVDLPAPADSPAIELPLPEFATPNLANTASLPKLSLDVPAEATALPAAAKVKAEALPLNSSLQAGADFGPPRLKEQNLANDSTFTGTAPTLAGVSATPLPADALPARQDRLQNIGADSSRGAVESPPRLTLPETASGSSTPLLNSTGNALPSLGGASTGMAEIYQLRTAPDRAAVAARLGGSHDTEAAVAAALAWLAKNQSPDGKWDADAFGAGRESKTLGHDRGGAGAKADTGITGLALLTFLANGNTHLAGDYSQTVQNGLNFIASKQAADGSLGGEAEPFAYMYCHGMATLAISEALAMTGDTRLRGVVQRAIGYTVNVQNRRTGGWRYKPFDSGDTSQLGWQLMALKSAEMAGMPAPRRTLDGVRIFLTSVSDGKHGGLASYMPGERISRAMTAEALACRMFLGDRPSDPSVIEAADFILSETPGVGSTNYYYWYYGTLALFQQQGPRWERWNAALTSTLLGLQRRDGEFAGSWDMDVWGGYGGRVYTTSIATLSLEVYYRYLPMHAEVAGLRPALRR